MRHLLFALAFAAALQAGAPPTNLAASLFDRGRSFAEFLTHVSAQREVWLRNAARTDIPRDAVAQFRHAGRGLQLLIVAEDWCPDSVYTVPYVANLSSEAGVPVRIVDRSAGDALMAQHPARDGRKVTPTIVLLRDHRDAGAWIERPAILQEAFFSMATNSESARLFADRVSWYEHDRGRTTIAEIIDLAGREP